MTHIDSFNFNFGIKFVDASTSAGADANNFDLAQTGDMFGLMIAFVLMAVTLGAFAFYFVRRKNLMNASLNAASKRGSHAKVANCSVGKGASTVNKFILAFAVIALACSGIAFACHGAQAFAEGSTPIIKAYVDDNGSVSVKPLNFKNSKKTDIKFKMAVVDLWGECYADETLLQSNVKIATSNDTIWDSAPDGVENYPDVTGRIRVGQSESVSIEITNLDPDYAKSLIGSNVYFVDFEFEDAVVPYPTITEEFTYDNKPHCPCEDLTIDSPYYLADGSDFYETDACQPLPETPYGDPVPYKATLELKNGFVWENPVKAPDYDNDPYSFEWKINKRTLSLEWDIEKGAEITYDGTFHASTARVINACEGHDIVPKEIYYATSGASRHEVMDNEIVDVNSYMGSVDTFQVFEKSTLTDKDKNYEIDPATKINFWSIVPKTLEIKWDSIDTYHEYDGTNYAPTPVLNGVCRRWNESTGKRDLKDDVSAVIKYVDKADPSIEFDPSPKYVGDFTAIVDELTGEQADNYLIPENCDFNFRINPVPSDKLNISWPHKDTYTYSGSSSLPINPTVQACTGALYDDPCLNLWNYEYYKINASGEEEPIAASELNQPGNYIVYVTPFIENEDGLDITNCYQFAEYQKHFEFSIVKPVISFDWSKSQSEFDFNGETVPFAKVVPVANITRWDEVSQIEVSKVVYIKDEEELNEAIDAGTYTVKVTEIKVTPNDGGEPYTAILDGDSIEITPASTISSDIVINPAVVKVDATKWENKEGVHENSSDWSVQAKDLNFDYQCHNKQNNNLSASFKNDELSFTVSDDKYVYYKNASSTYSEIEERDVVNAGQYKVEITDFDINCTSSNTHLTDKNNYVFDTTSNSLEFKINPREFGTNASINVVYADETDPDGNWTFDSTTGTYKDSLGKSHKPSISVITDTITYVDPFTPSIFVSDYDLVSDNDYQILAYNSQSEPGDYEINIKGAGNYSSETLKTAYWSIIQDDPHLYYGISGTTLYLSPVINEDYSVNKNADSALASASQTDVAWLSDADAFNIATVEVLDPEATLVPSALKIKPESMDFWFYGLSNLNNVDDLSKISTANLTSINSTFKGCSSLESIDLSWMNAQKIPGIDSEDPSSTYSTFEGCSSLAKITVGKKWNAMITMNGLSLDGQWRTDKIADFNKDYLFKYGTYYKKQLFFSKVTNGDDVELHLSPVKTASVVLDASEALNSTDASNIGWFSPSYLPSEYTKVVFELNSSPIKITPTSLNSWFYECSNLTQFEGTDNIDTSAVADISKTFMNCESIKDIDISWLNSINVQQNESETPFYTFQGCTDLNSVTFGENWNPAISLSNLSIEGSTWVYKNSIVDKTANTLPGTYTRINMYYSYDNTDKTLYFSPVKIDDTYKDCSSALYNTAQIPWQNDADINVANIEKVAIQGPTALRAKMGSINKIQPVTMSGWFDGFTSLVDISGLSLLDTSKLTNISGMFYNCSSLTDVDLTWMNTSNVTKNLCKNMFEGCASVNVFKVGGDWNSALTMNAISLPGEWRTSSDAVVNKDSELSADETYSRKQLFCGQDTENGILYIAPNATVNATEDASSALAGNIIPWYDNADAFESVVFETGSAETGSVITPSSMANWFSNFENLTTIDGFENVDTSFVNDLEGMFSNCISLTNLDLSDFNIENAPADSTKDMLKGCSSLIQVDFGNNWNADSTFVVMDLAGVWKDNAGNLVDPEQTDLSGVYVRSQLYYGLTDSTLTLSPVYSTVTPDNADLALVAGWQGEDPRNYIPWLMQCDDITRVDIRNTPTNLITPFSMDCWFFNCQNLTVVNGLEKLDTSNLMDIFHMFDSCASLKSIDLTALDTTKCTNLDDLSVFKGCLGLKEITIGDDWNSKITMNVAGLTGEWVDQFDDPVDMDADWIPGKYTRKIETPKLETKKRCSDNEVINDNCQIIIYDSNDHPIDTNKDWVSETLASGMSTVYVYVVNKSSICLRENVYAVVTKSDGTTYCQNIIPNRIDFYIYDTTFINDFVLPDDAISVDFFIGDNPNSDSGQEPSEKHPGYPVQQFSTVEPQENDARLQDQNVTSFKGRETEDTNEIVLF